MRSILAPIALALAQAAVAQTTWYVDVQGTPPGSGTPADPYTSIDYALAQASTQGGDLVLVAPGTYPEQVQFHGKGVHVRSSAGPTVTVIHPGGSGSGVVVLGTDGATPVLEGFTVTGGTGTGSPVPRGGGIHAVAARLSLVDCVIEQNSAHSGGGIYLRNCLASVKRCVIRENSTVATVGPDGGGIHANGGTTWLIESIVEDNAAGNAIWPGFGGGIYAQNGVVNARRSVIRDNRADRGGGGLFANHGLIANCRITGNQGQFGGGILGGSGLFVEDSLLDENVATSPTGSNDFGGGVYGPVTLARSSLVRNRATGNAGGAYGATLVDCSIVDNWATPGSPTGLILIAGGVFEGTLSNCTLRGNWSMGDGISFLARGGGAANSSLTACKVYENEARGVDASGGGLANCDASLTSIHDNRSDGFGGGIHGGATRRCTVVGNSAALGGDGILASGQGTLVQNSIVWNNGAEILIAAGATASVTYSDVQGGFPGAGNLQLDPQFWDEAARDFHLQVTSPCIDAGDPTSPADPDGSPADMGAFPYDPGYAGG